MKAVSNKKHWMLIIGITGGAFLAYVIYKVVSTGAAVISDIWNAPGKFLSAVGSGISAGFSDAQTAIGNTVYNPAVPVAVTGDYLAPSLSAIGVTDAAAPDTDAQVAAYAAAVNSGNAPQPSNVSTLDALTDGIL